MALPFLGLLLSAPQPEGDSIAAKAVADANATRSIFCDHQTQFWNVSQQSRQELIEFGDAAAKGRLHAYWRRICLDEHDLNTLPLEEQVEFQVLLPLGSSTRGEEAANSPLDLRIHIRRQCLDKTLSYLAQNENPDGDHNDVRRLS